MALAIAAAGSAARLAGAEDKVSKPTGTFEVAMTEAEWKQRLTPAQYSVLRKHGTERPGSSPLDKEYARGTFHCAGCELPLFSSDTKFDSRTGWPSFWAPLPDAVGTTTDRSLFMTRTEVHCRRCGATWGTCSTTGQSRPGCATA